MRWIKRLGFFALGLVLVAGGAWVFRRPLLLHVPPLIAKWTRPIAPNQPITWQEGPAQPSAPPG